jgi:hypothetical protein
MNYKNKYLKYKKKYIKLNNYNKKNIGGSFNKHLQLKNVECENCSCNIDVGCNKCNKCIMVLIEKLKKDTNIKSIYWFNLNEIDYILIGEKHIRSDVQNEFYNFIKLNLNKCNEKIDLFIENYFHYDYLLKNNDNKTEIPYISYDFGLNNITNLLESYKLCDNFKIHYIDVRNNQFLELYNENNIRELINQDIYYNTNILKTIIDSVFEHSKLIYKLLITYVYTIINDKYLKEKITIALEEYKKIRSDYVQNHFLKIIDIYEKIKINKNTSEEKKDSFSHELSHILSTYDSYITNLFCIIKMCIDLQNNKNGSTLKFGYFGYHHTDDIYNLFFKTFENDKRFRFNKKIFYNN